MADIAYYEKVSKTRMIESSIKIKRKPIYITVLYNLTNINDIYSTPYDIVLCNEAAISQALIYIKECPEIASHIIGAYCKNAHEQSLAEFIRPNIHIGLINKFPTIEEFVQSINPTVQIWNVENIMPKLHIVVQVWKHPDPARLEELQIALLKNAENPLIHRIHISLDGEDAYEVLAKIPLTYINKIVIIPITTRLTFKEAMLYMSSLPTNDFAALINTDIYFDHTIRELWNISMKNVCVALLRYESSIARALNIKGAGVPQIFGPRNDSQDAWIFAVNDLIEHKKYESWDIFDFTLGIPGCDNTFAGELLRRKWCTINPAFSIYALHLHQTEIRNYNIYNAVSYYLFHLINPCAIEECSC